MYGRLSVSIIEVIEEFKRQNSEYADQRKALDMCGTLSERFKYFASMYGLHVEMWSFNAAYEDNPDPSIYPKVRCKNESGDCPCEWHVIVDAGMFYIDWSVRQYTLKTEYPHIIVKKEAMHL